MQHLLKHTSGCGTPCPRLVSHQSLFERGLRGAASSHYHLLPPCDPHTRWCGEDQQWKGRERNMLQLTAEPGKPGSPGSPWKESGDELPWQRAAFPLEMGIAVGDTYSCERGATGPLGTLLQEQLKEGTSGITQTSHLGNWMEPYISVDYNWGLDSTSHLTPGYWHFIGSLCPF